MTSDETIMAGRNHRQTRLHERYGRYLTENNMVQGTLLNCVMRTYDNFTDANDTISGNIEYTTTIGTEFRIIEWQE